MLHGLPNSLDDLILIIRGIRIALERSFAARLRLAVVMRRRKHYTGDAEFFTADLLQPGTRKDSQIDRDKRDPVTIPFQHKTTGINGVVNRLIRFRSDIYPSGSGHERSLLGRKRQRE